MRVARSRPILDLQPYDDDAEVIQALVGHGNTMGVMDHEQWNSPPTLFQWSGRLSVVEEVERMAGKTELARIEMNPSRLKTWMEFASGWEVPVVPTQRNPNPLPKRVPCPEGVVEHFYNMGSWPVHVVPPLRGVSNAPAVRSDGSLVTTNGYDPEMGVYFQLRDADIHAVAPDPPQSHMDVAKKVLLEDVLGDFSFADQADRANAVGAMLTGLTRWAFAADTPLPMYVLDATMQQSGKGTLAGVIARAWGGAGMTTTYPGDDAEMDKRIVATLRTDAPVVIWDNVEDEIDSPALASLLTERTYSGRILGTSQSITLANDRLWMATGNNIKLGKDLPRRSVWIRQEPSVDPRLGKRTFRHANLLDWVDANVARVWWALLTLVRRWVADGMPEATAIAARETGNYAAWSKIIGGILESARIDGFLDNRARMMHDDTASEELSMLVDALAQSFAGEQEFSSRDVTQRLHDGDTRLLEAMPARIQVTVNRGGSPAIAIGKLLASHRGQRCGLGDMHIEQVDAAGREKRFVILGAVGVYKGSGMSVVSSNRWGA